MGIISDQIANSIEYVDNRQLLNKFLGFFSITWARKYKGKSKFTAFLLKPDNNGQKIFSKDREILLICTEYTSLFPRVVEQVDHIRRDVGKLRIDPVIFFITGRGENFEKETAKLNNEMDQHNIIIPFVKEDILSYDGENIIGDQIRKYRQFKDLFDISTPVSEDIYYFGRQEFTQDVSDRLRRGNNLGIFGLRKMGKTSLINRCMKIISSYKDSKIIYIDLQNTALYKLRWWELLEYIAIQLGAEIKSKYNQENGAKRFNTFLNALKTDYRYIIAFDEIEHIYPGLSSETHWSIDFLDFWKTLRSIQNSHKSKLSYIISGVNATVAETSHINDIDNPLFSMLSVLYMPEFSNKESDHMIDTLGQYMGVSFDTGAKKFITQRFGGHPMLIRLACSKFYKSLSSESSNYINVSEKYVKDNIVEIESDLYKFAEHILFVLKKWYINEYHMLEWLAQGENELFQDLSYTNPEYISHLKKYKIIDQVNNSITINLITKHLLNTIDREKSEAKKEEIEKWTDISAIRNTIEPLLRKFIKQTLKVKYGKSGWISKVLEAIPTKDRDKLVGIDADTILNSHLYLLTLREVINIHWNDFKFLEMGDRSQQVSKVIFLEFIDTINKNRQDAHAKSVTESEIGFVKIAGESISRILEEYVD